MVRRHLPLRAGIAALLSALALHAALAWWMSGGAGTGDGAAVPLRAPAALQLVAPRASALPLTHPVSLDVAVRPEPPMPRRTPAPERVTPAVTAAEVYASPRELDRGATPRSAPDISVLAGLPLSGLPMRLRLFIDRNGTVDDVKVLQANEDEAVLAQVRRMFLATAFVAGRLNGADVASYKDVELTLGAVL